MIKGFVLWIRGCAALLTSLSLSSAGVKGLATRIDDDLSLKMLAVLTTGLLMWVCYGL